MILFQCLTFFSLLVIVFCLERQFTKSTSTRAPFKEQPNIVFVLADDYGYNDIGYHGSLIKTPNLDKLAMSGVKLENYYVQPICTPTRSQLMSGRYQIHTGLQHGIIWPQQPNGLPLNSPTIADKLKEAGYSTHMVGKWHLGFYKEAYTPWKRGFDTFFGYLTGSESYYTHKRAFKHKLYLDFREGTSPAGKYGGNYSTHVFTEKAKDLITSHNSSKPLFLYLAYQAVHGPLEAPKQTIDKFSYIKNIKRRKYAAMVSEMDSGVGDLVDTLKKTGKWKNTIFIFSTDNGGEETAGGNNFPLRGHKGSLWEGGMRGIGFVAGAGLEQRGVINNQLLHVTDWFPTLVSIAGGSLNGTKPLDGFDQWETISKGITSKRKIILHNIDPLTKKKGSRLYNSTFDTRISAAVRSGDMKLLTGNPGTGKWTPPPELSLTVNQDIPTSTQNLWLFNITADPTEKYDLSNEMPEKVKELLDVLLEFQKTAVRPKFPHFDNHCDPAKHGGVWGPWM